MENQCYNLWIMGPTSSGKTTIADALLALMRKKGTPVIHFDGDEVRDFFGKDFGFVKNDRLRVVKTLVHLANKSCEAGMNVIVSALTANDEAREYVYSNLKNKIIVLIECDIETCIARDPKGLYKAAIEGEIDTLIGYNTPYKIPKEYTFSVNTNQNSLEDSLNELLGLLSEKGYQLN